MTSIGELNVGLQEVVTSADRGIDELQTGRNAHTRALDACLRLLEAVGPHRLEELRRQVGNAQDAAGRGGSTLSQATDQLLSVSGDWAEGAKGTKLTEATTLMRVAAGTTGGEVADRYTGIQEDIKVIARLLGTVAQKVELVGGQIRAVDNRLTEGAIGYALEARASVVDYAREVGAVIVEQPRPADS